MSVFTAHTADVSLPTLTSHPEPDGTTAWVLLLDASWQEPWIVPCDNCGVVDGTSSYQSGCPACRDRGWFDTRTGLPVKLWWWQSDAAAAPNWLLHTLVPELLRACGHDDFADEVEALPKLTEERLGKRIAGSGLLERITATLEKETWERLPVHESGGRTTPDGWHSVNHPVWRVASDVRWEFRASRVGWWAYRAAHAARDLALVAGISDRYDTTSFTVDEILDDLLEAHERQTAGLLLVEEDVILGPDLPERLHHDGSRCQSRTRHGGQLIRCEIASAPRLDVGHVAHTADGAVTWGDDENVDVPCPSTFTAPERPEQGPVQCDQHRYRHPWIGDGLPAHQWCGPVPDGDGMPNYRVWTDTTDGASDAGIGTTREGDH
jgi:hypothetical protein